MSDATDIDLTVIEALEGLAQMVDNQSQVLQATLQAVQNMAQIVDDNMAHIGGRLEDLDEIVAFFKYMSGQMQAGNVPSVPAGMNLLGQ